MNRLLEGLGVSSAISFVVAVAVFVAPLAADPNRSEDMADRRSGRSPEFHDPHAKRQLDHIRGVAPALGLTLSVFDVKGPDEITRVVAMAANERVDERGAKPGICRSSIRPSSSS